MASGLKPDTYQTNIYIKFPKYQKKRKKGDK
ncbi:MAG: hypothetical protein ACJAUY_000061 [Cognaticolwellia sp.]|jgi:hypothetical protein